MRSNIIITITIVLLNSCTSPNNTQALTDTATKRSTGKIDSPPSFEQNAYFKIDKIYSGPAFEEKNHPDVFYRILEIPEEENISLYAEKIAIGEEGGNYQLVKRIRLTDEDSVLPKFSLSKVDSLKFIDSVKVSGYFNGKKLTMNLNELK